MRYRRKKFTFAISSPDEFLFDSVTGHGGYQVVEESYFVNLEGQKRFGIGIYDLYFGFRIVEIFDDKM